MYLMYVDESGDCGLTNSMTRYFILTGMIIHEVKWRILLDDLIAFRQLLKEQKGLKMREEIHASHFVNKPGELSRIKRNDRIDIMKKCVKWVADHSDINIISIVIDKSNKTNPNFDAFEYAWKCLIQRFENTILNRNFHGPANSDERGMIIPDDTEAPKLMKLLRRMRRFNLIRSGSNSKDAKIQYIIEDPFFKNSSQSYFHQIVDVIAYFLRQKYEPNNYMKKKGSINIYDTLEQVVVKDVNKKNPLGIVEL